MTKLTLPQSIHTFDEHSRSSSNIFNYMLGALKTDINELYSAIKGTSLKLDNYILLYDEDTLNTMSLTIDDMINRYNIYAVLLNSRVYSDVILLDFSKSLQPEIPNLYEDPLHPDTYLTSNKSLYDPTNQSLNLPTSEDTVHTYTTDIICGAANNGNLSTYYSISREYKVIDIDIIFTFTGSVNANYLVLDPNAYFPFNVKSISCLDVSDTWVKLDNTTINDVFSKTTINFAKTLTHKLKLTVSLDKCKTTNYSVGYSDERLLRELLTTLNLYNSFTTYTGTQSNQYSYVYHFGLKSPVVIGCRTYANKGIFVGQSSKVIEPAHFAFDIKKQSSGCTVEYYLKFVLFDKNGVKFNDDIAPIAIYPKSTELLPQINIPNETEIIKTVYVHNNDGTAGDNSTVTFTLPYCFKETGLVVKRYLNNDEDKFAPVLTSADYSINGRYLTLEQYDIESYPKLTSARYEITGTLVDGYMDDNTLFYYVSDNSLLVNWEKFVQYTDYGYTLLYPIVIMRTSTSVGNEYCSLTEGKIYHNSFNDLLKNVNTI